MANTASQFVGNIPANYDRGLGPHIFADFGADIARRAAAPSPKRVLEIAAGTGIVTRMLRDALHAGSRLVATDLNPPMLEVAKGKFKPGENITFEQTDAQSLPFTDSSFDAVICQFGVMFFPDKDKAYREAFRVLSPHGRYVFNIWDSFDHNPFGRLAHETIGGFFGADKPTFYLTPFGYAPIDPAKVSLMAAGFRDVVISVLSHTKIVRNARLFAEGLVLGNPIAAEIASRATAPAETIIQAMEAALKKSFGPEPLKVPMQIVMYEARKPGEGERREV
jgi:SAM-dependent methyltransferase